MNRKIYFSKSWLNPIRGNFCTTRSHRNSVGIDSYPQISDARRAQSPVQTSVHSPGLASPEENKNVMKYSFYQEKKLAKGKFWGQQLLQYYTAHRDVVITVVHVYTAHRDIVITVVHIYMYRRCYYSSIPHIGTLSQYYQGCRKTWKQKLKGHGHGVRVWIFLRICIINLDRDGRCGIQGKSCCVHILLTKSTDSCTQVCGNIVTAAL